jgi:hypothetical protein
MGDATVSLGAVNYMLHVTLIPKFLVFLDIDIISMATFDDQFYESILHIKKVCFMMD